MHGDMFRLCLQPSSGKLDHTVVSIDLHRLDSISNGIIYLMSIFTCTTHVNFM